MSSIDPPMVKWIQPVMASTCIFLGSNTGPLSWPWP